jgi:hypothetical protein
MKYLAIFLIYLLFGCQGNKPEKTGMEGKPLPSFALLLADSTTIFNTANIPISTNTVFVIFGPQCPYSQSQIEEITTNIDNLKDIQFYFFTPYPFSQMKRFYEENNLRQYSNIIVGYDTSNYYSPYIGARGVPYITIYDKNKLLNKAFVGKVSAAQIKEIVNN